ncbi:hypothetical protein BKA70DRAFT_1231380 [Coprinopsis sp. MPI-PUGE-AT-0042]|nr:hypothetical protein BKA70DRAFT_1231380 [Coprinopsis sp. MPI-PUGE-AT-0042]
MAPQPSAVWVAREEDGLLEFLVSNVAQAGDAAATTRNKGISRKTNWQGLFGYDDPPACSSACSATKNPAIIIIIQAELSDPKELLHSGCQCLWQSKMVTRTPLNLLGKYNVIIIDPELAQ